MSSSDSYYNVDPQKSEEAVQVFFEVMNLIPQFSSKYSFAAGGIPEMPLDEQDEALALALVRLASLAMLDHHASTLSEYVSDLVEAGSTKAFHDKRRAADHIRRQIEATRYPELSLTVAEAHSNEEFTVIAAPSLDPRDPDKVLDIIFRDNEP